MTSVNNGSIYQLGNDSAHSFVQPSSLLKSELKTTSSFADLYDLQTQLETKKKLQEGAHKLLQTTEKDIVSGKYDKQPEKRKVKRLEAQLELNNVNRQIMTLERKIEAVKRLQAQETTNSFSYMKGAGQTRNDDTTTHLIPNNPIHNITFASTHSSTASTPMLDDPLANHHEDDSVIHYDSLEYTEDENLSQLTPSQGTTTWFLSELLQSLGQKSEEEEFYIEKSNQVVDVLKNNPDIINNLVFSTLGHRIQFLLLSDSKEVIACGYRIARYVITDINSLRLIKSLRVHHFLIFSLSKSSKFNVEREQAIKLIRRYFDIEDGHRELSVGVVKTLAMIVGSVDDELKGLITETLCELMLLDCKLVYEANGVKSIIKIINEGPMELACMCGMILSKILDSPNARKYLRNGEELGQIVYYFVNNFDNIPDRSSSNNNDKSGKPNKIHLSTEKLHNSAFIISSFLKTWVGLSAFAVNDFDILKTLIASLSYDIPILRDVLMDIFFDILKIRSLPWMNNYSTSSAAAINRRASQLAPPTNQSQPSVYASDSNQVTIISHYTTVLLAILLKCGLVEQVTLISQNSTDEINRRKSMFLLTEIFSYSVNLLPRSTWEPHFESASMLGETGVSLFTNTQAAQTAAFQLEKITRKLYKNRTTYNIPPVIFNPYFVYSENIAAIISSNIDDMQLRRMIDDTKVLITKRFTDWGWDTIMEIIKGPFRIPKKFEECLKNQFKFVKRMMSFYRPFKRKFMLIKKTKNYQKYINIGVALFETLLSHNEGTRYLSENKLLPQIAECLAQVDPVSGLYAENPIFSKHNLKTTLSSGYFKMLGVLSKSRNGLALLRKWKIFSILHHIINERGREDLILGFLSEFDYNLPSQLRIIFAHSLTSCDSSIRMFSTKHLAVILTHATTASCSKWAVGLLINQLYDPGMEICNIAVQILDAHCLDPRNIGGVVKYKPSLDHLGNIGAPLLLRFLSTPLGFNDLLEIDFIEKEMQDWYVRKNDLYVLEIENLLNEEYMPFRTNGPSSLETGNILGSSPSGTVFSNGNNGNGPGHNPSSSILPPGDDLMNDDLNIDLLLKSKRNMMPHHFYGELVKTQAGFALLQSTNHFQVFVDTIKELATESIDERKMLHLRGCLWAVGHIGMSELAIDMVDESNIIQDIIQICKTTKVWSIKGTAFFVLGLLSNLSEGLEVLDEFGWDVALDVNNNPTTFCVPKNLKDYFSMPPVVSDEIVEVAKKSKVVGSEILDDNQVSTKDLELQDSVVYKDTEEVQLSNIVDLKIIQAIANFSMTPSNSIKQLNKLETKYKERFSNPDLLLSVMFMLENYSFKFSARTFILQMFADKKALENVIKKDRTRIKKSQLNS
ncbi:TORC2 complex subunit [Saccharomycopsis crataegensis]|uniref:TORC2 complex subunit n=1 Tax=Saccharomycopsis crataegensis TaxID=43959 RepID=A0AAV5QSU8_9ASCO|nr:TORC2 complex subunit [Saccharomycopsis crataegensis]